MRTIQIGCTLPRGHNYQPLNTVVVIRALDQRGKSKQATNIQCTACTKLEVSPSARMRGLTPEGSSWVTAITTFYLFFPALSCCCFPPFKQINKNSFQVVNMRWEPQLSCLKGLLPHLHERCYNLKKKILEVIWVRTAALHKYGLNKDATPLVNLTAVANEWKRRLADKWLCP